MLKSELIKVLRISKNVHIDLFKVIFLNTIPKESNTDAYFLKLAFVALYRDAIWTARNQATHKNYVFTANKLANSFISRTKCFLRSFKDNEAVKHYSNDEIF